MRLVPVEVRYLGLVLLTVVAGCDKSPIPDNAHAHAAVGGMVVLDSAGKTDSGGQNDTGPQTDSGSKTDTGVPAACSDGKDNDGDGLVDWHYDLGCYGPDDSTEGGLKTREIDNGWSVFEPSKDTKIIYVSSSAGSDANRGTSPAKPKKTLAAALRAARSKHPDWVLLARGDTWTESLVLKEGRSRNEPFVLATYGTSTKRPLLKTGANRGLLSPGSHYNNFAVVGVAFYAHTRDPKSSAYTDASGQRGFSFYSDEGSTGQGVLLEDCWFNFYKGNSIQGLGSNKDVVLRRNIITNSYSNLSHSQGLYSKNASILLEENIFDHNGWHTQRGGEGDGQATMFNHNTYFVDQHETTFRRNMFLRPSSMGNKWTANSGPGSAADIVIDDNLYVDTEIAIDMGGNDKVAPYRFKNVTVRNNVILDLGRSRPTNRTLGWGLIIDDWDGGKVSKNLFLHQPSTEVKNALAIHISGFTRDVVIEDNVVHGIYTRQKLVILDDGATSDNISFINNKLQSQIHKAVLVGGPSVLTNYTFTGNTYYSGLAPNQWFEIGGTRGDLAAWKRASGATGSAKKVVFADPTRSIETYQKALGKTATIDAFITAVLGQSKYEWRSEYTAAEVNEWFRAGFVP